MRTFKITTWKSSPVWLIACVLVLVLWQQKPVEAQSQPAEILAIYFTPPVGAQQGLIKQIDQAKKTIRVMAYGFTQVELAQALVKAKKRGVQVELIQDDKSANNNREALEPLFLAGIEIRSDAEHAIFHNKVMLIDDDIVITGSYNFTKSAEKRNAENIVIFRSAYAAKRYADNWAVHWQHAEKMTILPPPKKK